MEKAKRTKDLQVEFDKISDLLEKMGKEMFGDDAPKVARVKLPDIISDKNYKDTEETFNNFCEDQTKEIK